MTAGRYTLHVEQGATLRLALSFSYDTGELDLDDQPVFAATDFTGAFIAMQIRAQPGTTVLAEASTVNGGIVIGDDGELVITLTGAQTANVTAPAKYDLIARHLSGDTTRLLEGSVAVNPAITVVNDA